MCLDGGWVVAATSAPHISLRHTWQGMRYRHEATTSMSWLPGRTCTLIRVRTGEDVAVHVRGTDRISAKRRDAIHYARIHLFSVCHERFFERLRDPNTQVASERAAGQELPDADERRNDADDLKESVEHGLILASRERRCQHLLAAGVNSTVMAGENLTVGSTVWLPAEGLAPGR